MLVLDENLPAGQRQLLRDWRIRFRVIGQDVAARGATDENLLPVLQHLPRPTLFTLDRDFYRPARAHPAYGLVWLDVKPGQAAAYMRLFLRHHLFDTQAKRMGLVARVHADGVAFWHFGRRPARTVSWSSR